VRGLLDVFDPDFLVAEDPSPAKAHEVDLICVIRPDDIRDNFRDERIGEVFPVLVFATIAAGKLSGTCVTIRAEWN